MGQNASQQGGFGAGPTGPAGPADESLVYLSGGLLATAAPRSRLLCTVLAEAGASAPISAVRAAPPSLVSALRRGGLLTRHARVRKSVLHDAVSSCVLHSLARADGAPALPATPTALPDLTSLSVRPGSRPSVCAVYFMDSR